MDLDTPCWADLWSTEETAERGFAEIQSVVRSRELEDLREMGIDVDDAEALKTARADRNVMAQLHGRQLRAVLAMRRMQGITLDPRGIAEELRQARERLRAGTAGRCGE